MTLRLRRVVTGHDADGKAIVAIDDFSPTNSARPGVTTSVVWTSEGFPIRNDTDADESRRENPVPHRCLLVFPGAAFSRRDIFSRRSPAAG